MSYTIVTSFILQKKDIGNTEKIKEYMNRFEYIQSLHIPTIVFLDKTLTLPTTEFIHVIPYSLEDTWIYKLYADTRPILTSLRNISKDTDEYMFIQNSKAKWVYTASILNPFDTDYFIWVDFGISHVISNKTNFNVLKTLKLSNTTDILLSAINHHTHDNLLNQICWRFAGGLFILRKTHAKLFYETCQTIIKQIYPHLTWEVNIWCFVEKLIKVSVYYADHNDTLLLNINPS